MPHGEWPQSEDGRAAAAGIQAVLSGTLSSFSQEYACHSPTEHRYFRLDVVPMAGKLGGAVITHTALARYKRRLARAHEPTRAPARSILALADEIAQIAARQRDVLRSRPSRSPVLATATEARQMHGDEGVVLRHIVGLLDTIADPIALYGPTGNLVRANCAYVDLFALDRNPGYATLTLGEQAEVLHVRELATGRPLAVEDMAVSRALRGEKLIGRDILDVQVRALDGRELDVSVSVSPVHAGGKVEGPIVGAFEVLRDVTDQRRMERERSRMMDLVAHELRHPLAILEMADGLIRKDVAPRDRQQAIKLRELLDFMDQGVVEMERLVQDLVDAAHLESGHLALDIGPTDLAGLVRQVADDQMRLRGTVIQIEAPGRRVTVRVDRRRIAQVLTNLLSNAFKYSPANTPIQVRLRRCRGEVCVEVHNEGPAIPPEAQAHLFERFYRVPETKVLQGPQGGLGLGLYLCRQVVQLHGGEIGVESAPAAGTTFWFTLPLMGKGSTIKPGI